MRRINSRAWPVGAPIPHEDALAAEFNVARGTIRQALSSLVEAGFLDKKRRSGTRVAYPSSDTSTFQIGLVREEIEAGGHRYDYTLLDDEMTGEGRQLLCLHMKDGQPFQLEQRTINTRRLADALEADFEANGPGEWLLRRYPYTRLDTEIRAASANDVDRAHLRLSEGEPVFVIERQTFLEDAWLTRVRLSHRASAYSVATSKVF